MARKPPRLLDGRLPWAPMLLLSVACTSAGEDAQPPAALPSTPPNVGVTLSISHVCAWKRNASAYCWGRNGLRQLGHGAQSFSAQPGLVRFDKPILDMSVGAWAENGHSCAVTTAGDVYCWGNNGEGQVGGAPSLGVPTPRLVPLPDAAKSVALGGLHSCALLATGEVYCWGFARDSALGAGSSVIESEPNRVLDVDNAVAITSGSRHTCALLASRRARCWGNASTGGLGYGDFVQLHHGSYEVVTGVGDNRRPLSDIVQLSAAGDRTCAWVARGEIYCWGDSSHPAATQTPWTREVIGLRQVGAGCGVTGSNGVWCWSRISGGAGLVGQMEGAVWVEGTSELACVVTHDDEVHCRGSNSYGQLGDGMSEDRETFARVPGLAW